VAEKKKEQSIESKNIISATVLQSWREDAREMDGKIAQRAEEENQYYDRFSMDLSTGLDKIIERVALVGAAIQGGDLTEEEKDGVFSLVEDIESRLLQINRTISHEIRRRVAEEAGLDYWQEMKRKGQKEA
jgi:hypothetical protein